MTAEILKSLIAMNLAAGGAILLLLLIGGPVRRAFGARMAYAAWLLVPLAAAATLLPARQIEGLPFAPPPVRPMAEQVVFLVDAGPVVDWMSLALIGWAAGVIGLIALTVWTQSRTLGLIGRLTPEGGRLRSANPFIGPAILGVFRPRIMLPSDFEQRFDEGERAVIMAHEENHLATGDQRINAAVVLVQCLFWFNPLIHIAARRIRIDQELACDAAVIARFPKARRTYAQALLKTQVPSAPLPLGCYWPVRSHKRLKERLTMLTLKTPGRARRIAGAACLAALGIGTGYAAWAAAPEAVPAPRPTPEVWTAPAPAPEPAPAPVPAPQSLTNAAPQPPALPVDQPERVAIFRGPLPEGVVPGANTFFMSGRLEGGSAEARALGLSGADGMAIRIECHKVDDDALSCSKNGEPVAGEALEKLKAMMPPIPATPPVPGAQGLERRTIILNSRRPAE